MAIASELVVLDSQDQPAATCAVCGYDLQGRPRLRREHRREALGNVENDCQQHGPRRVIPPDEFARSIGELHVQRPRLLVDLHQGPERGQGRDLRERGAQGHDRSLRAHAAAAPGCVPVPLVDGRVTHDPDRQPRDERPAADRHRRAGAPPVGDRLGRRAGARHRRLWTGRERRAMIRRLAECIFPMHSPP